MSRVLVVDDEPGFAKLVQALLGAEHAIDEVSSAEAALASLDDLNRLRRATEAQSKTAR